MRNYYQALLSLTVLHCICLAHSFDIPKISKQLDNAFLSQNITEEESQIILAHAREAYKTLMDYRQNKDPAFERTLCSKVRFAVWKIVKELLVDDLILSQLFEDIADIIRDLQKEMKYDLPDLDEKLANFPELLSMLEEKIGEHYTKTRQNRPNMVEILSTNDTNSESIFREESGTSPSSIGYFFLETLSTILGLSWGLFSMIFTRPQ